MGKGKTKVAATKVKELKLVDGKADGFDPFANIKTIDDILGTKPQGPFKAKSLAEFEQQLDKEMNLADMQALATRVGLIPVHDRPILRKRLCDEFRKNQARLKGISPDAVIHEPEMDDSLSSKAANILKQGR